MHDYVAGKADWLAADLPFEGSAQLAGRLTRRQVATASESTPAQEALHRLRAGGFGPVVVVNQAGVVMGEVHQEQHAQVSRVVVTRSDGTLIGLFFAGDAEQA